MSIRAIFWDFGGVVADSPFANLSQLESRLGLPENFLRMTNAENPDTNAWACFERGDIDLDSFGKRFLEETRRRGHPVDGRRLIPMLEVPIRPVMVEIIGTLSANYLQGCLTNNLPVGEGAAMSQDPVHAKACQSVLALFDFVQESSQVGCRKPEPRFYQLALERAEVAAQEVLFLDDLGINLKPARAMGMTTIKVTSQQQAILELEKVLGTTLRH